MSSLRSRIDDAFYAASSGSSEATPDAPGGFLLDAGGFLPPSPPAVAEHGDRPSCIPLSRIPHALQLLDLPPDDEEVLAVFRNAASGWGDDNSTQRTARGLMATSEDNDTSGEYVSLKDWRAVCHALMDVPGDDEDCREGVDIEDNEDNMGATGDDLSSEVEEPSGGSSDEYRITKVKSRKRPRKSAPETTAGGAGSARRTRARKSQSADTRRRTQLPPTTGSAGITARQQRECLRTFLLFFPGVPEEVAECRRLGVREVNAAAAVLNEKIKTEEVRPLAPARCHS